MISEQSNLYFKFFNKIKYLLFKSFYSKNLNKFIDLIKFGVVPRPHYALGLLLAAFQAKEQGIKKFL